MEKEKKEVGTVSVVKTQATLLTGALLANSKKYIEDIKKANGNDETLFKDIELPLSVYLVKNILYADFGDEQVEIKLTVKKKKVDIDIESESVIVIDTDYDENGNLIIE